MDEKDIILTEMIAEVQAITDSLQKQINDFRKNTIQKLYNLQDDTKDDDMDSVVADAIEQADRTNRLTDDFLEGLGL